MIAKISDRFESRDPDELERLFTHNEIIQELLERGKSELFQEISCRQLLPVQLWFCLELGMPSDISIRSASNDDAAAIARLSGTLGYSADTQVISRRLKTLLRSDGDLIIVAVNSTGQVIGWLQAHAAHILESGFRVEITGLIVSAEVRRGGVGRLLVSEAERWACSLSAEAVIVRSNVERVESHLFYPALGYRLTKTQKVYRKSLG